MFRFVFITLVIFLTACAQTPQYSDRSSREHARPRPTPYNTPAQGLPLPRPTPSLRPPQNPNAPSSNYQQNFANDLRKEEVLSAPQTMLLNQAQMHLAQNETDQAASLLERAIRINPQAVKPYRLLAELRLQQGNKQAAIELARKGLALIAKKGDPVSYSAEKIRLEQLVAQAQRTRV